MQSFNLRRRVLVVASAAALGFGMAQSLLAADAAARTGSPATEVLQEVVVTGTSLRGVAPVGSTATVVSRDDVLSSTAIAAVDMLQELPQVTSLGVDENHRGGEGSGNRSGASAANIRGLGAGTTLTLINSHRVAPQGLQGTFVDPSVVPSIAVERVEVVADGASAVYGSDAVAGVINMIPRTKFDGVEVSGRWGSADSYNSWQLGAIFGKDWSSGGLTLAVEGNAHDALLGRDRSFVRLDLRPFGGLDYRNGQCNPGNYVVGGSTYYKMPTTGPVGGVTVANANLCDLSGYNLLTPKQERSGAYVTFHQRITDRIEWQADGYAYSRDVHRPTYLTGAAYGISAATPAAVRGAFANGTSIQFNLAPYVGDRAFDNPGGARSSNINTGLVIDAFSDWQVRAFVNYSRHKEFDGTVYGLNTAGLTTLINTSVLNPQSPALLSDSNIALLSAMNFLVNTHSKQTEYRVSADGSLFHMPGGAVRAAIGAAYRDEELTNLTDRSPAIAPVYGAATRKIKSAYAEFQAPLVGADNSMAAIQKLDFNVAVRYDDYGGGVGSTTNPKFGLSWVPVAGLTIRGSYGKSFRAPVLNSFLPASPRAQIQLRTDPVLGPNVSTLYIIDSNPNLKPEKADTWSAGFDLAPTALHGFKASVTWWSVDYTDKIGGIGLTDASILNTQSLYGALVTPNPTLAQLTAACTGRTFITAVGSTATGCTDTVNIRYIIDARAANVGVVKANGIDFDLRQVIQTERAGTFTASLVGTYFDKYSEQVSSTAPAIERTDLIGYPVKVRHRTTVGWARDRWSASLAYDFTGSYVNNTINPNQHIDSYGLLDLNLGYNLPKGGALGDLRIGLNVKNLTDQDPPFVNSNSAFTGAGYDAEYTDPVGRLISLVLTKRF